MKLRAPSGCTCVSHGGRTFAVEADGSLDVAEDAAAPLAAHGFTPWRSEAAEDERASGSAPDIESLNRPALFALLREKGVRVSLPIRNAELREAARRAVGAEGDGAND